MKLNESNKGKNTKKKRNKNMRGLELTTFWLKTLYHNHRLGQCKTFHFLISTCDIPVKLTLNTESRRKVKLSCALTVKLRTCVRLIKLNNNTIKKTELRFQYSVYFTIHTCNINDNIIFKVTLLSISEFYCINVKEI